ncbi:transposase [Poseidonocella sp. HB161398]|uniref:transposase n=1 Tax=Poseidonocella sp. HB161398 TaxID=2320855 RepID=UPI0035123588
MVRRLPERRRALAPPALQWLQRQPQGSATSIDPPDRSTCFADRIELGEWATRQRRAEQAVLARTGKTPPARKIARLLTRDRENLSKEDALTVARVEAALPALATARALADSFTEMVRNGTEDALAPWLDEAGDSMLGAFARGLRKDFDAVAAALTEPWSNGQTEGQINRLKMLKRQMYGRAGVATPKARLTAMP